MKTESSRVYAQVEQFIHLKLRVKPERITASASLQEDFGLDGDDAVEFFEDYATEFEVDLREMRWDRHFGPESFFPLVFLWPRYWSWRAKLKAIQVSDLVDAATAGRWTFLYEKKN